MALFVFNLIVRWTSLTRSPVNVSPIPEPGKLVLVALRLGAPVLGPLDVGVLAEDARRHERADVEPDAVVEVGVPADRLLGEGLPADEDVVGRLARQDELELVLQLLGGGQAEVGPGLARLRGGGLGGDPVLEVGVGQGLEPPCGRACGS